MKSEKCVKMRYAEKRIDNSPSRCESGKREIPARGCQPTGFMELGLRITYPITMQEMAVPKKAYVKIDPKF